MTNKHCFNWILSLLALLWCSAVYCSDLSDAIDHDDVTLVSDLMKDQDMNTASIDGKTPLAAASQSASIEVIDWLVANGADVNHVAADFGTALGYALVSGQLSVADFLLEKGARVNLVSTSEDLKKWGASNPVLALTIIKEAPVKAIQWLLDHGAELDVSSRNHNLPTIAALAQHESFLLRLLDQGTDLLIEQKGGQFNGIPVVFIVAFNGLEKILRQYFEEGGSPAISFNQASLLSVSIRAGNEQAVRIILEAGALISLGDEMKAANNDSDIYDLLILVSESRKNRIRELFLAAKNNNVQQLREAAATVVELEVDLSAGHSGLSLEFSDRSEETLALVAVNRGYMDVLQFLLDSGVDITRESASKYYPLYLAVTLDSIEIAELLISEGGLSTPNMLEFAIRNSQWQMATLLMHNGVSWTAIDNNELLFNRINLATEENEQGFLIALTEAGFSFEETIHYYETPLFIAATRSQPEIVGFILDQLPENHRFTDSTIEAVIEAGRDEVLMQYLSRGLTADSTPDAPSYLLLAAAEGGIDILELLLTANWPLKAPNYLGTRALVKALETSQMEVFRILAKYDIGLWDEANYYRSELFGKLFDDQNLNGAKELLAANSAAAAPLATPYLGWSIRQEDPAWAELFFQAPQFQNARKHQAEELAETFMYGHEESEYEELSSGFALFAGYEAELAAAMFQNWSASKTTIFIQQNADNKFINAAQELCQTYAESGMRRYAEHCSGLAAHSDETSLAALAVLIKSRQEEQVHSWLENNDPHKELSINSEVDSRNTLGELAIMADNAALFAYLLRDELIDYYTLDSIAEYSAINILEQLSQSGELSHEDLTNVLRAAATLGDTKLVTSLLEHDADWQEIAGSAISEDQVAILKQILDHHQLDMEHLLQTSVKSASPLCLNMLLEQGVSPNIVTSENMPLLASAIQDLSRFDENDRSIGQYQVIFELLKNGANVQNVAIGDQSIIEFLLNNRLLVFFSTLQDSNDLSTAVNSRLAHSLTWASGQHDLEWLHALDQYTHGDWLVDTLASAFHATASDPIMQQKIQSMTHTNLDKIHPQQPAAKLGLSGQHQGFDWTSKILGLPDGNLILLSNDKVAVTSLSGNVLQQFGTLENRFQPDAAWLDPATQSIIIVDEGGDTEQLMAWQFSTNSVRWSWPIRGTVEDAWLDTENDQMFLLVGDEFDSESLNFEQRRISDGKLITEWSISKLEKFYDPEWTYSLNFMLVPGTSQILVIKDGPEVLADGEQSSEIVIVDWKTGQAVDRFNSHSKVSEGKTSSSDGKKTFAFSTLGDSFEVWDLSSAELLHEISFNQSFHQILDFSYPHLVYADSNRNLYNANLGTGNTDRFSHPGGENFSTATFDASNSTLVASGFANPNWFYYEILNPKENPSSNTLVTAGSYTGVENIISNGTGNLSVLSLTTSSTEHQNWLWDLASGRPIRQLDSGLAMLISPDSRRLVSGNVRGLSVIDLVTGLTTNRFSHSNHYVKPGFSDDGREFWFVVDHKLLIMNTWSNQIVEKLPLFLLDEFTYDSEPCSLLLPSQRLIALCSPTQARVDLVNVYTGEVTHTIVLNDIVSNIYPGSANSLLIQDVSGMYYWIDESLNVTSTFSQSPADDLKISVHSETRRTAFASETEGITVINSQGELVAQVGLDELPASVTPSQLSLMDGGHKIAVGGRNSPQLAILNIADKNRTESFTPRFKPVERFIINEEENLLFFQPGSYGFSQEDGPLWDLDTGSEVARIPAAKNVYLGSGRDVHMIDYYSPKQDETRHYDLSSQAWKTSEAVKFSGSDYSLENRQIAYFLNKKKTQGMTLSSTKGDIRWTTRDLVSGKVVTTASLQSLVPYLGNHWGEQYAYYDGQLAVYSKHTVLLVDLSSGQIIWKQTIPDHYSPFGAGPALHFVAQGNFLSLIASSASTNEMHTVFFYDVNRSGLVRQAFTSGYTFDLRRMMSSENSSEEETQWLYVPHEEKPIALKIFENGPIQLVDAITETSGKMLVGHILAPGFATLSDDSRYLITSSEQQTLMWDLQAPGDPVRFSSSNIKQAQRTNKHVWLITASGQLEVHTLKGEKIAQLMSFDDGGWLVTSPEGRYDSDSPGEIPGVSWVLADEPLVPYPLEIFMREYYEPRLLPRLLADAKFPAVPDISVINRVQPQVVIDEIVQSSDGNLSVKIRVSQGREIRHPASDYNAYDLRLLRDGKQVAFWPTDHGQIEFNKNGQASITFEDIAAPALEIGDPMAFSALAFNSAGVKSPTVQLQFQATQSVSYSKRRAFVINVGINEYSNPAWNLAYAVNDAEVLRDTLSKSLDNHFDEVIPIPFLAESGTFVSDRDIEAVLAGLAEGTDQHSPITPEDSVILTWSGHGFATSDGQFHLITSDIGNGQKATVDEAFLAHSVSTDDLTKWFEPLDARNIIMVIDACNSAASVEGQDFKPGPMSSSGFGQLAWFKGMQIITASQSNDVALESGQLQHGLLTYSLAKEGIGMAAADVSPKNKEITASEWLNYGQLRVPQLYTALKTGTLNETALDSRGLSATTPKPEQVEPQTPGLFNFIKGNQDLTLSAPDLPAVSEH